MRPGKKILFIIFLSLLVFSIALPLSGCGSKKSTTQSQITNSTTTITSSVTSTVTSSNTSQTTTQSSGNTVWGSPDGIVFVSVPSGWNLNDTGIYPGAAIQVGDDANSEYLIVTEKSQSAIGSNATINDYLTVVKKVFATILSNPTWGNTSNISIGGCKGLSVQVSGIRTRDNANLVFFINILTGSKQPYFYNICSWTPNNMVDKNKANLEKMVNSFQEIWPPKPNTANKSIPNY